jgi:dihydrolipoamide dehydrogenase
VTQPPQQAQVVVIGAGPGGYAAAFRAADLGKDVTLIERYPTLGGVCLNVGCIPSKALLHTAKIIDEAKHLGEHGIAFGPPKVDLDGLRRWKDGVVKRLTGGLDQLAKKRKVRVVHATARFADTRHLRLDADGQTTFLPFEQAIIAAGSRSLPLPGAPKDDPRIMDSTGALELADVPKHLLVIGGGIIGLEMATVYAALGSAVTVVELLDSLMTGVDRDLVRPLERRLRKSLAGIHTKTRVGAVEAVAGGLRVAFEGEAAPAAGSFDRVLVAIGRRPNSDLLDVASAGIAVDNKGFVTVDAQRRTNIPHIFAIGDIAGSPMLAHKATHEGKLAAEVAAGERRIFEPRAIPSVAYTDPEVAWAGLTEEAAKAQGIDVRKAVFPWAASGRALALGGEDGTTKLLFDPQSGRLIGAGIVGPNAGDLISEAALAIEMGADAADIGLTIHPHPTLSETVAFASEVFDGTVTDLYVPRRDKN